MKHKAILLPTDKPTQISKGNQNGELHHHLFVMTKGGIYVNHTYQHLYILSDEEIKDGEWYLATMYGHQGSELKPVQFFVGEKPCGEQPFGKKIISSTDKSLKKWKGTCFSGEELYETLPTPNDESLRLYCENPTKYVDVETIPQRIEDEIDANGRPMMNFKIVPKISSNNSISFKPVVEEISLQEEKDRIEYQSADWEDYENQQSNYKVEERSWDNILVNFNMDINTNENNYTVEGFTNWLKNNYNPPTRK
jgi:hypothetical protein